MISLARSSTPLAAFGSYTAGWFNNTAGLQAAEGLAIVSAYSDQGGQVQIYQSDDITNANMSLPGAAASLTPGKAVSLQIPITHLNWRVVVQNGAVPQTALDVAVSVSASLDLAILLELQKLNFMLQKVYEPYDARAEVFDLVNS